MRRSPVVNGWKSGREKAPEVITCQLYLITPPQFDPVSFGETLATVLDAGKVACVQMRLKDTEDEAILRAAEALQPVCRDRGVMFLLNDRPDLARETGCDGVHVGQGDTACAEARGLLGKSAVIGVSCHGSRQLAIDAVGAGADYVAFGAFFPTTTKKTKGNPPPDILSWWRDIGNVPAVAIGGITLDNAPSLIVEGADFLAVVSAVWDHEHGPANAVKAFNKVISETTA